MPGRCGGDLESDPRHGKIVGTVDYVSPDHIAAPHNPMPAWDIYSLGCTLYYTVTGKVPFPGGTTADKARAHCELRPLDPRRLNPRLSAEFVDVLADMMAKDPAQRLQSAQVIERLGPWTRQAPPPAFWWRPVALPSPSAVSPLAAPAGFPPAVIVPPPVIAPPSAPLSAVSGRAGANGGRTAADAAGGPATEDGNSQDSLRVVEVEPPDGTVWTRRGWILLAAPALTAILTWFLARWFWPRRP